MQECDDRYREGTKEKKFKFVERGGTSLLNLLCRNNPWANRSCEREECLVCMSNEEGKGGSCEKESVVYCIDCKRCKEEEGKIAEYWGETARTAFLRGGEHIKGLKEKKRRQ